MEKRRTLFLKSQSVDLERVFLAANTREKRRVVDRLAYELVPNRHKLQGEYNGLISMLRSVIPWISELSAILGHRVLKLNPMLIVSLKLA